MSSSTHSTPLNPLSHNISSPNTPTSLHRKQSHGADDTFSSIQPPTKMPRHSENLDDDSTAFSRIDRDFAVDDGEKDFDGDDTMGEDSFVDHPDPGNDTQFSMVGTDMTEFYQLLNREGSPSKNLRKNDRTPKAARRKSIEGGLTPRTVLRPAAESPSPSPQTPSPRRRDPNVTTNLLLDFTTQFENFQHNSRSRQSPTRNIRGPRQNSPSKQQPPATPTKPANLLDFEIPPAPTPRSIPSVTPREVELLKSEYLSQLASLKAEIRGKEAECKGLKEAVADAEDRCGKARQEVEDLRSETQGFEAELTRVRELAKDLEGDLEREKVTSRDLRKRLEEAQAENEELRNRPTSTGSGGAQSPTNTKDEVQKVAKELHALYKQKHENKVAALKKSYESRWENVVKDLEDKVKRLQADNEELKQFKRENSRPRSEANSDEMANLKSELAEIQATLEAERREKSDLITMVEELLQLQPDLAAAMPPPTPKQATPEPETKHAENERRMEGIRSIGKSRGGFGLKPPTSYGQSRIARPRE